VEVPLSRVFAAGVPFALSFRARVQPWLEPRGVQLASLPCVAPESARLVSKPWFRRSWKRLPRGSTGN
jgi:hypothetical protein